MGLPVFREPVDSCPGLSNTRKTSSDPTARARSSIRRQPPNHTYARRPELVDIRRLQQQHLSGHDAATQPENRRAFDILRSNRAQRARDAGEPTYTRWSQPPHDVRRHLPLPVLHTSQTPVDLEPETSHMRPAMGPGASEPLRSIRPLLDYRPQSRRGPSSESPSPEIVIPEAHPLRRMDGRSINDTLFRPNLSLTSNHFRGILNPLDDSNGLGDRERSPPGEWHPLLRRDDDLDDPWETLLTTITPDPSVPSASTSFASAHASAGNSFAVDDSNRESRPILPIGRYTPPRSPQRPILPQNEHGRLLPDALNHLAERDDNYLLRQRRPEYIGQVQRGTQSEQQRSDGALPHGFAEASTEDQLHMLEVEMQRRQGAETSQAEMAMAHFLAAQGTFGCDEDEDDDGEDNEDDDDDNNNNNNNNDDDDDDADADGPSAQALTSTYAQIPARQQTPPAPSPRLLAANVADREELARNLGHLFSQYDRYMDDDVAGRIPEAEARRLMCSMNSLLGRLEDECPQAVTPRGPYGADSDFQ